MTKVKAELILASMNIHSKVPLYTFILTFPRIILAEVNTHRMLSRNTASSRAVPSKKLRQRVLHDPFVPISIGANKRGMQAGEELAGWRRMAAVSIWKGARYPAALAQYALERLGAHKQVSNRLVEPWLWTEQLVTATDLTNLFKLRINAAAEPHFQELAKQMQAGLQSVRMQPISQGDWHLPFIDWDDRREIEAYALMHRDTTEISVLKKVSAARCARVSYYLNSAPNSKPSIEDDLKLAASLSNSGHWSPFEHQATPMRHTAYAGNLLSWTQYRKEFTEEHGR